MTKNQSNFNQSATFFEPSPIKLVALTAAVMLICILASSVFIYAFAQNQAKLYTSKQVDGIKHQLEVSLQPMILAKDTLSMSFYLRSLQKAEFINGLTLVNTKRKLLARAGNSNGDMQKIQLFSQQLEVGELTLFINTGPANHFFTQLLWIFSVLAALTSLCVLLAVGYLSKKILIDFSNQYRPLLQHRFAMELAQAKQPSTLATVTPPSTDAVSLAIVDLDRETNTTIETTLTSSAAINPITAPRQQNPENQQLVSLLKPDAQQRMPHFKPFSTHPDDSHKPLIQPAEQEIELTESFQAATEQAGTSLKENPLLRSHPHEEQLDLYSLEHQTELSLKAADAAYLLFIDCSSGRAPIEEPEEHQKLLSQYRRLITLVINIYGGHLELLANGDIRVMFDDQSTDDNHGIQALCAAKLFNQLYKYYNHRQITRMQPTLNIQISLVRGNRNKIELLREESHFLTCTTASNELISHTPLSEVKALKDTLLKDAHTERQDEDKILILSLSPSYQELLEKQARHLAKSI